MEMEIDGAASTVVVSNLGRLRYIHKFI